MEPFPPPPPDAWRSDGSDSDAAMTNLHDPVDSTPLQPSADARRHNRGEARFQQLRHGLHTGGLAMLIAAPIGFGVFFGLAALHFAVDDRTFWASEAHSIARFPYMIAVFALVAVPPAVVTVRRGWSEAARFVEERYWKVLVLAYVVVPLVGGIAALVIGHIIIAIIVVVVLIIVLVHVGAF